ncbi:MAG: biopolymer transporter ExbD [Edaphobacter sp.]
MALSTTRISEGERLPAEINVTPLINILLVLLIIFMVIVPVAPHGLNASVPSTTSTGKADEDGDRPILVQMEQDQTMVRYS